VPGAVYQMLNGLERKADHWPTLSAVM
jgi:hypothetical protein